MKKQNTRQNTREFVAEIRKKALVEIITGLSEENIRRLVDHAADIRHCMEEDLTDEEIRNYLKSQGLELEQQPPRATPMQDLLHCAERDMTLKEYELYHAEQNRKKGLIA